MDSRWRGNSSIASSLQQITRSHGLLQRELDILRQLLRIVAPILLNLTAELHIAFPQLLALALLTTADDWLLESISDLGIEPIFSCTRLQV
jgi:hypothetical protein